jgi:ubiquinone/menaquinone biosynthesis C-methylase UbiE
MFDYEEIEPGYYDNVFNKNTVQGLWHKIKFSKVECIIGKTSYHLDIGCGPGTFLGNYLKNSRRIGVDLALNQIKYAKEKYNSRNKKIQFRAVKNNKLPFKDNNFSSISLIEIIEHLNDDEIKLTIKECLRCLMPGGKLVLTTPNYFSLWPLLEFFLNLISPISYKNQHISKFNISKMKMWCAESKLYIDNIGTFIYFAPFFNVISKKFARKLNDIEDSYLKSPFGLLIYCVIIKK